MQQGPSAIYLVIGFVAGFIVLWSGVVWLAAAAGGWRRLATHFTTPIPFEGEVTRFATARLRMCDYSGVLCLGVSELGISLVPIAIFRPFHAPLFIPWTQIEIALYKRTAWYRQGVQLTFPSVPRTSIIFYGRAADRLLPYIGRKGD
ncbi:hypothetical protein KKG90_10885 [Candidatus Bipolaricaulota bacterium]|nr:hypothetical protein [Candidatus Bipolaricaulota bacterium]